MKKFLFSLSLIGSLGMGAAASAADLPMAAPPPPPVIVPFSLFGQQAPVVVQLGPTTAYSTINCSNFAKLPDGSWKALSPAEFGTGFVQHIVPPAIPIKLGAFIYNNVDLYSQLELQCAALLVRARY